jgi:phosphate transport system substrate-binding protein
MPSFESIQDASYAPLSRPLFIYVRSDVIGRPEIDAFVKFNLSSDNAFLIKEVGYVALPNDVVDMVLKRFESKTPGTMYGEGAAGSLTELLSK